MPVTWTHWADDILHAINAPTTPQNPPPNGVADNVGFLGSWYQSEKPLCDYNPLIASYKGRGSTDCKRLPNGNHAQNYASRAEAISETARQFHAYAYSLLLHALRTNRIYAQDNWTKVALALQEWGATRAQADYNYFMSNTYGSAGPPTSVPPPSSSTFAPHTQHGWGELRKAINHRFHADVTSADKALQGALRTLHAGRKVGR